MVPVPIGPGIPRRDREDVRERYAKIMLILFKPWKTVDDLLGDHIGWEDAFDEFCLSAPVRYIKIMNNMQRLHECRDSRDD
ncbi:hypothetical protein SCHPADRAFT_829333, partial [Schizopora paradoxa]